MNRGEEGVTELVGALRAVSRFDTGQFGSVLSRLWWSGCALLDLSWFFGGGVLWRRMKVLVALLFGQRNEAVSNAVFLGMARGCYILVLVFSIG